MIINDMSHLETTAEAGSLEGGGVYTFDKTFYNHDNLKIMVSNASGQGGSLSERMILRDTVSTGSWSVMSLWP
ncbi:hypothetical protein [Leptolyngbya ohadii]|uniref:hypothetical protein n=1 Tax=Leptolyngbya ohadii TaxID=1962290 RepID=UPI001179FAF2|nr:hypothetical protein [Leptolyngbya ohadii]